jgi:hypothetical protein
VSTGLPLRRVMARGSRVGDNLTAPCVADHTGPPAFLRTFSRRFAPFSRHPALARDPREVGFGLGSPDKKQPNPANYGLLGPRLGVLDESGDKIRPREGVLGAEWRYSKLSKK